MNKIYKLIWSKVKNCWVVVSEITKTHSKNPSVIGNIFNKYRFIVAAVAVSTSFLHPWFYSNAHAEDYRAADLNTYFNIQSHQSSVIDIDESGSTWAHMWLATRKSDGAFTILYNSGTTESSAWDYRAYVWSSVGSITVDEVKNKINGTVITLRVQLLLEGN